MICEVIVQNKNEAILAEALGADRLELVSGMAEGGLTPSFGTIKEVFKSVSIPVQVMVRPHSYGYTYDESEMAAIREDIMSVKSLGCETIVFGCLDEHGGIDKRILEEVITLSPDVDLTFHRAFDEVDSYAEAYASLIPYKNHVKRILTAGSLVDCSTGLQNLKELMELARKTNGPKIMPGTGLTIDNMESIHAALQADEYHFGKYLRVNDSYKEAFDREKVEFILRTLKSSS